MKKVKKIFLILITVFVVVVFWGYIAFDQLRHEYYLKQIAVFNDPNFILDIKHCQAKEAYRFLWDCAFGSSVLITVFVDDYDRGVLNLRGFSEGTGKIFINQDILLSKENVDKLRNVVQENQFGKKRKTNMEVLDGTSWIIEAKYKNSYYWDGQICPKPDEGIWKIGDCLFEMSGFHNPEH